MQNDKGEALGAPRDENSLVLSIHFSPAGSDVLELTWANTCPPPVGGDLSVTAEVDP